MNHKSILQPAYLNTVTYTHDEVAEILLAHARTEYRLHDAMKGSEVLVVDEDDGQTTLTFYSK